jgi:hypothetical protein
MPRVRASFPSDIRLGTRACQTERPSFYVSIGPMQTRDQRVLNRCGTAARTASANSEATSMGPKG